MLTSIPGDVWRKVVGKTNWGDWGTEYKCKIGIYFVYVRCVGRRRLVNNCNDIGVVLSRLVMQTITKKMREIR